MNEPRDQCESVLCSLSLGQYSTCQNYITHGLMVYNFLTTIGIL